MPGRDTDRSRPRDYADKIAERLFPFDGSDPQTVIEARKRAAEAAREGYALGHGAKS